MTRQFYPTTSELPLLLDGRQNALIRPMNPQPGEDAHIVKIVDRPGQYVDIRDSEFFDGKKEILARWNCQFGYPGTELWCKESFYAYDWYESGGDKIEEPGVLYRIDEPTNRPFGISDEACAYEYGHQNKEMWPRWKSGVVMSKSACRLWLQVLEVKVMRIQDFLNGTDYQEAVDLGTRFLDQYGLELYETNPFVWIARVKRIEKP